MGEGVGRIGGYEILAKLGSGSVGTVYRARQVAMDRFVALKILNPGHAQDPSYVERFVAEARTAGRVNHANVCQVYEVGEDKDLYYFSMELVDGPSLADTLRERGLLLVPEALALARQVALALKAAHACGLVHRDVKPANILISGSGLAKLVDLGLAKDTASVASEDSGLAGTPYYMAPEQAQSLDVDIRSDIYSLGATLYHMLVGQPPFTGPHATAVMIKHASEPLTPPAEVDPSIPRRASALVVKMMAKDPDDRHADPDELLEELDAAISGKPAAAAPVRTRSASPRARKVATGPRRPVRARAPRGKGSTLMPLAFGGGAIVVAGLLIAIFAFSGPSGPAKRGDKELSRAESLIQEGTLRSLREALRVARRVPKKLPAGGAYEELRTRAERMEQVAENSIIEAEEKELDGIPAAVEAGRMTAQDAEAAVAAVENRYSALGTSARFQECISRLCTRARSSLARLASGEPGKVPGRGPHMGLLDPGPGVADTLTDPARRGGPPPRKGTRRPGLPEGAADIPEGSAVAIILPEIEKHLAAGQFADAIGMIDVMAETMEPEELPAVETARTHIRRRAEKAFAKLLDSVRRQVRRKRFGLAEAELKKAKANFGFAPFAERIDAELEALRRRRGARLPESPPEAPLVETPPEPPVVEGPPAVAPDDAEAALRKYLDGLGLAASGGTFALGEKGALKVVVPEGRGRATLTCTDADVTNVAAQFDARVLSGSGFRLQARWSGSPTGGRRGRGGSARCYALKVGPADVKSQVLGVRQRFSLWAPPVVDEDGYGTWVLKRIQGSQWNRHMLRLQGDLIITALNGAPTTRRRDESFGSGMVRFEFLPGTKAELRKIKIVKQ